MSSDTYERAEIGTHEKSWRKRALDTLQSLRQVPQTVSRQAAFGTTGDNVEDIDPPEDIDELVELYYNVGFIRKNLNEFVTDVTEPGVRVLAEDDTTQGYFMGGDNAPESAPEGGFLSEAFVFDQKRQHFNRGLELGVKDRWRRGTVLIEKLYAEPENPESIITGYTFVRPETVSARTYPYTTQLIDPEDTENAAETTKRGEAAAFVQFDEQAILNRRWNRTNGDSGVDLSTKTSIPLSQNDVIKATLDQDIGGSDPEDGVFGESVLRGVKDAAEEYKSISNSEAEAIQRIAFGLYTLQFEDYAIDAGDEQILIQWDEESIQNIEKDIEHLEPGQVLTSDAGLEMERFAPDLPDLDDPMRRRIREIIDALPAPYYKHSFADDINQFVTDPQQEDYQETIKAERNLWAETWEAEFKEVARRHPDLNPEGISVTIEPDEDESPVMSLSEDDIERLERFAGALSDIYGPGGAPTFIDEETLLTLILQLPEESVLGEEGDTLSMNDLVANMGAKGESD